MSTQPNSERPSRIGLSLAAFTLACLCVLGAVYWLTQDEISAAQQRALSRELTRVISVSHYNNRLDEDIIEVTHPLLGSDRPHKIWRARMDQLPAGAIMSVTAAGGYSGPIELLVGVYRDGSVAGVRVLGHRETPGLGDAIDASRSDWITEFNHRSLTDPDPGQWRVKKDGGVFDQLTGATITPRAVVGAVHDALTFYQNNRESIFAQ